MLPCARHNQRILPLRYKISSQVPRADIYGIFTPLGNSMCLPGRHCIKLVSCKLQASTCWVLKLPSTVDICGKRQCSRGKMWSCQE